MPKFRAICDLFPRVFFDFAVSSIAGGAGRTYTQASLSGPLKLAQDENIEAREIPFANIFLSARPEYRIERKYYEGLRRAQLAQEELKHYRDDADMIARLREEHGSELRLPALAKYTQSVLSDIRKTEALLDQGGAPDRRERKQQKAGSHVTLQPALPRGNDGLKCYNW